MGTKITGKYAGNCKICGSDWKVGEQIFYQKDPKAICVDKECFEEQGGKFTPYSGQGTLTNNTSWGKTPIITKLPDVAELYDISPVAGSRVGPPGI